MVDFGDVNDVIKLEDLPAPRISAPNEILVKVHYASVHVGDCKIIAGDMGAMAGLMGFKPPFFPSQDYSGTVVEIGDEVSNFSVGDRVFGEVDLGRGAAAQYLIVTEKAKEVYKVPTESMSMMEAAALQCSMETAYQALFDYGGMDKGNDESILILGGSTVIGMYAIQICKNVFECSKITVTSSREELCKSLGADHVVNYKSEQWEVALNNAHFDVILDVMGGSKSWNDCRSNGVLAPKGRYVTVCGDFEMDTKITCCTMCSVMCGVLGRKLWGCCCCKQEYQMVNQARSKSIEECVQLIVGGKVKPMVDEESPFKLEDYKQCFAKCVARKAHGKLLLQMTAEEENTEVLSEGDVHLGGSGGGDDEKYDQ